MVFSLPSCCMATGLAQVDMIPCPDGLEPEGLDRLQLTPSVGQLSFPLGKPVSL